MNLVGFFESSSVNFTRKLTFKGSCSKTNYELIRIFEKNRIMIIERTENEIVFRFPKSMKLDDLQDLTDLFEYKELTKKSKTTQKEVDELVKLIKKGRWQKTKQLLDE